MTYGELDSAAAELAVGLRQHGLEPGSRVLVALGPGLDFIKLFFACSYAGCVPVHGPTPRRPLARVISRLETITQDCGISVAVVPKAVLGLAAEAQRAAPGLGGVKFIAFEELVGSEEGFLPSSDEEIPLFIQYTSGSVTLPKGVVVSQQNALANCREIAQPPGSTVVCWLPAFHDFGLVYGVLSPIVAGVPAILMSPARFLQRPWRWLQAISDFRGTHTAAPNFAYELCVDQIKTEELSGLELSSWRAAINGAEPIRASTLRRFVDTFRSCGLNEKVFVPGYGLAESTLMVAHKPELSGATIISVDREALGRDEIVRVEGEAGVELVGCGAPKVGTEVAIAGPESCERLPEERVGEIWVKGPSVARGYWGDVALTESTFRARLADGTGPYLRTGDLGFKRRGELFVTGRRKDLIIINGINCYPQDVELVAERAHAAVRGSGVAAFAVQDGSRECLCVVAELAVSHANLDREIESAIRRAVGEQLGLSVHGVGFAKANAIPRTTSGKLQRTATRDAFTAGQYRRTTAQQSDAPTAEQVAEQLWVSLTGALQRIDLARTDIDRPLLDLGIDSVAVAELIGRVREQFGVTLDPSELIHASLLDVATQIGRLAGVHHTSRADAGTCSDSSRTSRADTVSTTCHPLRQASQDEGRPQLSVFYFGNFNRRVDQYYGMVADTARVAERLGFHAAWFPERHFHSFGGMSPNPALLATLVASQTHRLRIRAGSVIAPLHHPLRIAEEWSFVDNLSAGRVDLAFGTGWNANDFVLAPADYAARRDVTFSNIETVQRLWRGEALMFPNGTGTASEIRVYPEPLQRELDVWLTCTGGIERFIDAGARGYNVLTALLFQSFEELELKIRMYRNARKRHGHDPLTGRVSVMFHTFVGETVEEVRSQVRQPMLRYLESSADLWKHGAQKLADLSPEQRAVALEYGFERYFDSSLFGTAATCAAQLARLDQMGVDEVCCLLDFGLDSGQVIDGLHRLNEARQRVPTLRAAATVQAVPAEPVVLPTVG